MAKWQTQPTQNRQGLSVSVQDFTLSGAILFSSWVPFLLFVVQCADVRESGPNGRGCCQRWSRDSRTNTRMRPA